MFAARSWTTRPASPKSDEPDPADAPPRAAYFFCKPVTIVVFEVHIVPNWWNFYAAEWDNVTNV